MKKEPPPPPPPRRGQGAAGGGGITTYPLAAASYVGTKASSAWQHAPAVPHSGSRANPNAQFSTNAPGQFLNRSNTSSTIGTISNMAGGGGNGDFPPEMSKREVLWRQRWARAEGVLKEKGVVLRSWRVGSDVMKEAEGLVKKVVDSGEDRME